MYFINIYYKSATISARLPKADPEKVPGSKSGTIMWTSLHQYSPGDREEYSDYLKESTTAVCLSVISDCTYLSSQKPGHEALF